MADQDLTTLIERLRQQGPQGEAADFLKAALVEMIRLTLHRAGRETLQSQVNEYKDQGDTQNSKVVVKTKYGAIEPDAVSIIGPLFCDRLCAGG